MIEFKWFDGKRYRTTERADTMIHVIIISVMLAVWVALVTMLFSKQGITL